MIQCCRVVPYIPHEEGIEIIKKCLNQKVVKYILTKRSFYDLATINIKNNFFKIGEEVYQQLALGTKFVPTYTNLFMSGLD